MPAKIYIDWNRQYQEETVKQPVHNQDLFIMEPIDGTRNGRTALPADRNKSTSNSMVVSRFDRFHTPDQCHEQPSSKGIATRTTSRMSPPHEFSSERTSTASIRPLKSSLEQMQATYDDSNDSVLSTANRSIHLPVEKQRGLSEIIRKRNSRYKVEDYKRSFQRSNTYEDEQRDYYRPLATSKSDQALIVSSNNPTPSSLNLSPKPAKRLNKTKSFDMSIEIDDGAKQRTAMPEERLEQSIGDANDDQTNEYVVSTVTFRCRLSAVVPRAFRTNGPSNR